MHKHLSSSRKSSMASKADKRPSNDSTTTSTASLRRPSSRRSNSLSSSTSLSSNSSLSSLFFPDDSSPISPTTPLRFSGIPFSWEKLPGIPKKQNSKNKHNHMNDANASTVSLLPLPPSSGSNSNSNIPPSRKFNPKEASVLPTLKKYNTSESFRKDPFFAALIECSKDDEDAIANHWKGSKVNNRSTFTDRLGLIGIYTSCKRTCAVSGSIVYLPRSTHHYLLNRR